MELPPKYKPLYSSSEIEQRLARLGPEIGIWVSEVTANTKQQVLAVCILRGGAFFFTDLLRQIPVSIEPTFCRTWSYSSKSNEQASGVRVSVDEVVAEGRAILMVDDICDTGSTLAKLEKVFLDLGASAVKSVVLVHRIVSQPKFKPSWSAFEFDSADWLVGYGMEDCNYYSNLPGVYRILK